MKTKRNDEIILTSGERMEAGESTDLGVKTDAGTIAWSQIESFVCWSRTYQRWMTVPVV